MLAQKEAFQFTDVVDINGCNFLDDGQTLDWYEIAKPAYNETNQPTFIDEDGQLIEGIYIGMPNDVYHSLDALNSSKFKKFMDSPAKFYRDYISAINRKRTIAQKRTLEAGSLGHELVLEPENFYLKYFRDVVPSDYPDALYTVEDIKEKLESFDLPKTGKKSELAVRLYNHDSGVEIFDIIQMNNRAKQGIMGEEVIQGEKITTYGGKIPVDGIVWDDAHRVCETVRAHREANYLLKDGLPEVAFIAKDPVSGFMMKVKFDWLKFNNWAVDLKTTQNSQPEKFLYQILDLRYDIQQEFYRLVAKLLNVDIPKFIFVAVEYANADICQPFELGQKRIIKAREDLSKGLNSLKKCIEENRWYGWSEEDTTIVLD